MSDIKEGDIVALKSGGPVMTVETISDYEGTGKNDGAYCHWFDGKKPESKVFRLHMLEKQ